MRPRSAAAPGSALPALHPLGSGQISRDTDPSTATVGMNERAEERVRFTRFPVVSLGAEYLVICDTGPPQDRSHYRNRCQH